MPFMIAPFPGQTYPPRYARNEDIKAYIGYAKLVERQFGDGRSYSTLKAGKVPAEYKNRLFMLPLTDGRSAFAYYAEGHVSASGARGKSSRHRCFVRCPDCRETVPAGRTHQHQCKTK